MRNRRFLIRFLLVFAVLLAAAWIFENWRGTRAWEEARARAEAAGVSLVRADYAGPEIPDEENLLLNPVFAEEFDRVGEDRLGDWSRSLGFPVALSSGGLKPHLGQSFRYRDWFDKEVTEEEARQRIEKAVVDVEKRLDRLAKVIRETPNHPCLGARAARGDVLDSSAWLTPILGFLGCFRDSACLAIRQGDGDRGLQRMMVLHDLSELIAEPSLIGAMVSAAIKQSRMDLIWEGIRLRLWDESQLAVLGRSFGSPVYERRMFQCLHYEAAYSVDLNRTFAVSETWTDEDVSFITKFFYYQGPPGWQDLRKAAMVNQCLDLAEIFRDRDFDRLDAVNPAYEVSKFSPLFAVLGWHSFTASAIPRASWIPETTERICRIAIAAEREFLSTGTYPEKLEKLRLDFSVSDLTDPDERDLAYELGPNGRPQIWSRYQEELGEKGDEKLRCQFWAKE